MIKRILSGAIAALAVAAMVPVAMAQTIGIGGGLGIANIGSQSGGSVTGGGINGGMTSILGTTTSQTTQTAGTTGLAGTKVTLGHTGPSIVSEHSVSGFAQQTTTGTSLGGALSGGVGGSGFSGNSVSGGTWSGIHGFLGLGF